MTPIPHISGEEKYTSMIDHQELVRFLRSQKMTDRSIKKVTIEFQPRLHPSPFFVPILWLAGGRNAWGLCIGRHVYLATYYVKKWGVHELNDTLVHELAHACTPWLTLLTALLLCAVELLVGYGLNQIVSLILGQTVLSSSVELGLFILFVLTSLRICIV